MFSTPNTHGGRTLQRLIWLRAQRFLEAGLPPDATPGLVDGHFDQHEAIAADLVIDTSALTPEAAADQVLAAGFPDAGGGALTAFPT